MINKIFAYNVEHEVSTMIISCPKCQTKYEINTLLSGKKTRCAKCGEVWRADQIETPPYQQLIEPTIIDIQDTPPSTGTYRFWWSLFFICLLSSLIMAAFTTYKFRYQLVAKFPQAEIICNYLQIDCRYFAQGLSFSDVTWEEYVDESQNKNMGIIGTIYNNTQQELSIPTMHIELSDDQGKILQSINQNLGISKIKGNEQHFFKTKIEHPSPFTKYIRITFKP